ncbi:hypothetical protein HYFRA_00003425 [Hymenoscyphus fraxineus]|uniref:Dihydrolipoamide acetyltransferase component of pyruvate dehydrogenase complex n=1 Tax=Hymenoscyphus fraxineus TaxID=746836 RepID=A0A9N9PHL7_9HELO|nr:hypothetical protein HYFRA_00003425 [Hymenoscyphus fraxineus]
MRLHSVTRSVLQQVNFSRGVRLAGGIPGHRAFHSSRRCQVVKPFLLADIGEGIRECEIIQWFVEPEARVEEWDKLCEVQSDKASVEITSRFGGVIKKLHYEAGDMAKVGKPLLDIDIQSEVNEKDLAELTGSPVKGDATDSNPVHTNEEPKSSSSIAISSQSNTASSWDSSPRTSTPNENPTATNYKPKGKHASLATPAVRHLTKELKINLADIQGTGREGRVMKEDVHAFARQRAASGSPAQQTPSSLAVNNTNAAAASAKQIEMVVPLTNTQSQMFKSMTKALSKPHFLYADELDFSKLSELRSRLNKGLTKSPVEGVNKLSFLPFIVKAMSLALHRYPMLNARVDAEAGSGKPVMIHRSQHNIGVAMDTPSGLLVPVIKNVASLNIIGIAAELSRLQSLAASGKLSTQDLTGGTITLSNIGSIGGTYVSPVIVEKEVAILGVGKMRTIPAFGEDGQVIPKQVCNFSWSADHRVIDGATMARAAEVVKGYVEDPDSMIMRLR